MRIRKRRAEDTRALALDASDLLLFWQLPEACDIHLLELLELVPGDPSVLVGKLYRFASLGLIEIKDDGDSKASPLPARASAPPIVLSLLPTHAPPSRTPADIDPHVAITAIPDRPLPIAELFGVAPRDVLRITLTDEDAELRARALTGALPKISRAESVNDSEPPDTTTPVRGFRNVS